MKKTQFFSLRLEPKMTRLSQLVISIFPISVGKTRLLFMQDCPKPGLYGELLEVTEDFGLGGVSSQRIFSNLNFKKKEN